MAFKKPLNDYKTSAPLKNSDRRKLKQRVVQLFSISPEEGDLLVPDGLQSTKFVTHVNEPGTVYDAEGNPLWFTIGKGSEELLPTVYTLWKKPDLIPFLSTPAPVIPRLIDGADLMIPGVVHANPSLKANTLVSVMRYERGEPSKIGPPMAIGRMAVDATVMTDNAKGKAVLILHTYKDHLWQLGKKGDPPEPTPMSPKEEAEACGSGDEGVAAGPNGDAGDPQDSGAEAPPRTPSPSSPSKDTDVTANEVAATAKLSEEEVDRLLRTSLIQAIYTKLNKLPQSDFPMQSSTFYTSHILPARPASRDPTAHAFLDVKHSSFKSLSAFLKQTEKDGLIKIKEVKGGKSKGEVQVLAVFPTHPDVRNHAPYMTVGDAEAKRAKKEKEEQERNRTKEISVAELYKPHQSTVELFKEGDKDTSALYTAADVKVVLNAYISKHSLVNPNKQAYINVDDYLTSVVSSKNSTPEQFYKREDLMNAVLGKMQSWHRIEIDGKEPVLKKGQLSPIAVTAKIRQGRKACTLITNFEPYLLNADDLSEDLRKLCASATSMSPLPGKNAGLEVMVQGKQLKIVSDFLLGKGIPKKWIEASDLTEKKK